MEVLLYGLAWVLVKCLQAIPLRGVAWIGRRCGALVYWLDRRHRHVAIENLLLCFGKEKSKVEIRQLAREHFRRLGENYACAIKTAGMPWEQLKNSVEFAELDRIPALQPGSGVHSHIVAIGHFGNFELYARFGQFLPGLQCATTYRALNQPSLNRLIQSLRQRSQCLFFERRTEAAALKAALGSKPLILGLLTDQHAGDRGLRLPFFGQDCSTNPAPAVLALRYNGSLNTGFCYRVALGRWRLEAGPEIPTREGGRPRSVEAIMRDVNLAFEAAVRRDPANWFWVHKRWKPSKGSRRSGQAEPSDPVETASAQLP